MVVDLRQKSHIYYQGYDIAESVEQVYMVILVILGVVKHYT